MSLRVVHEASAQRQFVRLRAPLTVRIGNREYPAYDWSVAGIGVRGLEPPPQVGHRLPLSLLFRFEGFAFEVDVEAEVRHVKPSKSETGLVLVDVPPETLSLLQYLVSAWLSGEVVQTADVLAMVKRDNFTGARAVRSSEEDPAGQRRLMVKNAVVIAGLWLAGLALLAFVLNSIYTRNFVVEADGFLTSPNTQPARAPDAGVVTLAAAPGQAVVRGQPLATIRTVGGVTAPVLSPCTCLVHRVEVGNGAFVEAGGAVAAMVPSDAVLSVEALVPLETARRIRPGDVATVDMYASGRRQRGRVEAIVLPAYARTDAYERLSKGLIRLTAVVRVRFDERQPISSLGAPTAVRIDTLRPPRLAAAS